MEIAEIYRLADICSLPVNPLEAARALGIKTVSYKTVCEYYHVTLEELYSTSVWGFCFTVNGSCVIALNENSCGNRRRRFTAAHELGHCVLGHLRGAEYPPDAERDADRFAAELLAPICVLDLCGVRSAEEIERICGVSRSAAEIAFQRLVTGHFRVDSRIVNQFADFIARNSESAKKFQKNP